MILIPVILLITSGYLLAFEWLVPKMGTYTIPHRWRNLPLRESKTMVHAYLGEPASLQRTSEEWIAGTRRKQYQLKIFYLQDSIASSMSIRYRYIGSLFSREYLLDSSSIK